MPNPKTSSQDWFYHAPLKRSADAVKDVPPASQIPGLGNHEILTQEDLNNDPHLHRKWVRDTDSDYVKLAKAGGRRDLFQYREYKNSGKGPKGYPRVDWFDHTGSYEDGEKSLKVVRPSMPNWYVHDEYICQKEDFTPTTYKRPLLGFDNLSMWKRDEQEAKHPNYKLPLLHKQRFTNNHRIEANMRPAGIRLPPISVSNEEGNMGQLLSMGYQSDWLKEQEERKIKQKEIKTEEKKKYKEKLDRDQEYIDRKKRKDDVPEVKPLFKISKFGNVTSRVDSFRT